MQTMWDYGTRITECLSHHWFVFRGRVFIPVHAKENSVHMVETDQDHDCAPHIAQAQHHVRLGGRVHDAKQAFLPLV